MSDHSKSDRRRERVTVTVGFPLLLRTYEVQASCRPSKQTLPCKRRLLIRYVYSRYAIGLTVRSLI
jgi:hypothetical protein